MKIIIEITPKELGELESIFNKKDEYVMPPVVNTGMQVAKDFRGNTIFKGKYQFMEDELAQRNTDTIKFDERLRGLICYVKNIVRSDCVNISIPAQKGWETPVDSLDIHPNWIQKCL